LGTPVTKTDRRVSANGYVTYSYSNTSTSNKAGNVVLRKQTAHSLTRASVRKNVRYAYADAWGMVSPGAETSYPLTFNEVKAQTTQIALAKFNGKLRKGDASLGITIAQWGQANEMITHRLSQVAGLLGKRIKSLEKNRPPRKRYNGTTHADQVLEVEFGWKPLFADMHAAMYTVCQDGIPPTYLVGRHKQVINIAGVPVQLSRGWKSDAFLGTCQSAIAADVAITNPNLWLLNRLGLINPVGVLWDAIPWSFLVGAFVNVNAMINSLTNEVGLSITNASTTEGDQILWTHTETNTTDGSGVYTQVFRKRKSRSLGSLPKPTWQVRVPEVSFETALILSSLVVQRFARITSLFR
jgi:hypothetical protein